MNNPTLFCWIGNTDVEAMAQDGNAEALRRTALLVLKSDNKLDNNTSFKADDKSSIILALKESLNPKSDIPTFKRIILLTNRPAEPQLRKTFADHYHNFIVNKVKAYSDCVEIKFIDVDAYNFEDVYDKTKKLLDQYILAGHDPDDSWYNITPGTIAQQTTWIMVGKERSASAHFIQGSKHKKKVSVCTIPFDPLSAIGAQASFIESDRTSKGKAVGRTPSFTKALNIATKIAKYPVNVLLTGESGVGKEVFADAIHKASGRTGAFVAVNCATLSKELGIAELTGYLKGAFTGADKTRTGKLQEANNGTLFLDEIGDCPLDFQAELLRILQPKDNSKPTIRHFDMKGPIDRDGDPKHSRQQTVDVRIICATNRDLSDPKVFREDLYYRIGTFPIRIPSLEERKAETDASKGVDDIKDLSDRFLLDFNSAFLPKSEWKKFSTSAYAVLHAHTWKGNVRELQNVVTRAALISNSKIVNDEDISDCFDTGIKKSTTSLRESFQEIVSQIAAEDIKTGATTRETRLNEFQHFYFTAALKATNGNKREAYTALKVNPRTFDQYLKSE